MGRGLKIVFAVVIGITPERDVFSCVDDENAVDNSDQLTWHTIQNQVNSFAGSLGRSIPLWLADSAKRGMKSKAKPIGSFGCPLGEITLRFMVVCVFQSSEQIIELIQNSTSEIHDAYGFLNNIDWSAMVVDHEYPWPVFSMLDCLQRRIGQRRKECMISMSGGSRPFLQTMLNVERNDRDELHETGASGLGTYEPPELHSSIEALLSAGNCTLGSLSAALAIGEVTRDFDHDNPFGRTLAGEKQAEAEIPLVGRNRRMLIRHVQRRADIFSILRRWPIWAQLDRLSNSVEIIVTPRDCPPFFLYVVPQRLGTNGLQASRIRTTKLPYCSEIFQTYVEELLVNNVRGTIRIVDVGSAFGDCMLWTAARVGCERTRAVGFDLSQQLSRLAFKSAVRNNFTTCVGVRWGNISDVFQSPTTRLVRADSHASHALDMPHGSSTLDHELGHHKKIHIVKIHTITDEDRVVLGTENIIRTAGVGIFVIHIGSLGINFFSAVLILQFLELLNDIRYDCMAFNDTVVTSDTFEDMIFALWERSVMFELICRRRDLLEWIHRADDDGTPQ